MEANIELKKHFITGGAGFIGSHLVDKLLNEGKEVIVYDNLVSGKKENIAQHIGKAGFSFLQADLLKYKTLKKSMQGSDIIWHLGSNTDIPGGNANTDLDLKNCAIATYNVLESMRHNNIKIIIFASTSCVYGDVPLIPLRETQGPLLPISLYGAGKLACEGLLSSYSHLFGLNVRIYRFGNVVGARMGHGVIYDFIRKLQKKPEKMEILGDGNQEKNFFLVEDCLEGMLWGFQKAEHQCDVFNLGCETTVRVSEIGRIVAEEMGLKDVKFEFTGGVRGWLGDAPFVKYDVSKMKGLGWQARHTSAEAVRIATRRLIESLGVK